MSMFPTVDATLEDHEKAFTEVAFLLDIFAATVDNIMGGATASVGRIAGRAAARKLPVHLVDSNPEAVVEMLAGRMKAGYEFRVEGGTDGRQLVFDRCVLREVCARRSIEPGAELCRLFHSYFDGILNELISRPVKSEFVSCGAQCRLNLRIQ